MTGHCNKGKYEQAGTILYRIRKMSKNNLSQWILIAAMANAMVAKADVKLPAVFSDHMVLQQSCTITIWGWAQPREEVHVKADWTRMAQSAQTDSDGRWSVQIRTPSAGGPHRLTVSGQNTIVLQDVLIGEVWICSGQSNMQLTMGGLRSEASTTDAARADYPHVRLFTVKNTLAVQPQPDLEGIWQICTPETVKDFSAVAFYFGRRLYRDMNVPVGLITASWGGTMAESWISAAGLEPFDEFHASLAALEQPEETERLLKEQYGQKIQQLKKKIDSLDGGIRENWNQAELDDSDWKTIDLPAGWHGTELEPLDGIVWFRRIIHLPSSWISGDLELSLGPIDDIDTVWINGVHIGTTLGYSLPRVYRIPAATIRSDINWITVRVTDIGFNGGFIGQANEMRISPEGNTGRTTTYVTLAGPWKYKIGSTKTLPVGTYFGPGIHQNTPTVLYNAMIHPLIPFCIAGVIFYHGEAHCHEPLLYRTLFPALINDWRRQWGQGDFPFYYVQIAPYIYNAQTLSQLIRETQFKTLRLLPNTGMAVTIDIGEQWDVHPRNKWDVGERLARWALAKTYGHKDVVYSGPLYKEMRIEQNTIRILFNYTDGGLVAWGDPLTDFTIAGEDRNFVPANAVIEDDTIVVSSPEIQNPIAVRYAWTNWACPNLFNAAGLPASSFRTDDWPLQ
jgi:sialate O-acetylesterase